MHVIHLKLRLLLCASNQVEKRRQNEDGAALGKAGDYPKDQGQVIDQNRGQSNHNKVWEARAQVDVVRKLFIRWFFVLTGGVRREATIWKIQLSTLLALIVPQFLRRGLRLTGSRCLGSVSIEELFILIEMLFVAFREAALVNYGHEGKFPSEENEGNVAEKDHQEQTKNKQRSYALLVLNVVENGSFHVLFAEVGCGYEG